ncbi:MAG: hypothetical protein JWM85_3302, partial [Acidimicrobiaceae bacterium]|nr:hypothetical protein [Acidimicrobiaceae bacterium]
SAIYNAGNGEPGWLVAINHSVGNLVGAHGVLFAACAGVVQGAIGLGILGRRTRTVALVAGIAVALFYGVVGQDLGGIFSNGLLGMLGSGATDPGSGPVVALLALCLWASKRSSTSLAATAWAPLHAERRDAAA